MCCNDTFVVFNPVQFGNFALSASTLFALLNGDSVLFIFQSIQRNSSSSLRFFGQICTYARMVHC